MVSKKVLIFLEAPFVWFINLWLEILEQIFYWIKMKRDLTINLAFKIPLVSKVNDKLKDILIYSLRNGPVPKHVSFIMDGNRRYAKSQKVPIKKGHEAGGVTFLTLVYICKQLGVKCVSCYAFSIENFKRPKEEVDTLMELFAFKLDEFASRANDYKDPLYGSKLKIIGDRTLLPPSIIEKIKVVESITEEGTLFTLYVCLPYTSRNDIHRSICKNILNSLRSQTLNKNIIDIKTLSSEMYMEEFSDKCDLVIRTSGHKRLSDYMLWQGHENSTIEFSNSLWPEFAFFEMFIMLLKWSFFQNIQTYKESSFSIQKFLFSKCRISAKTNKSFNYEDLPPPPQIVSVTEKKG